MKVPSRILIYGAGVIGCLYAALLNQSGENVTVLSRGQRLASLRESGLLYRHKGHIVKANVRVIDTLPAKDAYDYIFLTVRADQLHDALLQLKGNISPAIVTMVNTLEDYATWEAVCGKGRILPAFPGAGGGWQGDALDASLTPRITQPTTFGGIHGERTLRVLILQRIFSKAGIPSQIVHDMHLWQLCHLGRVVPLADAYTRTKDEASCVWRDKPVMSQTVSVLRQNMKELKVQYGHLSPAKMNLFCILPRSMLQWILPMVYKSQFGNKFMYQHAMKAKDEMTQLHDEFYAWMKMNAE